MKNTGEGRLTASDERLDQLKQQIASNASLVGVFAFTSAFALNRPGGIEGQFNSVVFPSYIFFFAALFVSLRKFPQYLYQLLWAVYAGTSFYVILHLNFALYYIHTVDMRITLFPLTGWLSLSTIIAFAFFSNRRAIQASVAYSVIMLISVAVYVGSRGAMLDPILRNALIQPTVFSQICYMALMAALSKLKDIVLQSRLMNLKLEQMAYTDELTGLPNRRQLLTLLASELGRLKRFGTPLAVVMVDLDHFKSINDRFGHDKGDEVLKFTAEVLGRTIRTSDWVGRWGGEEFLVILTSTPVEGVGFAADRLRVAIASEPVGGTIPVTGSFGVAVAMIDDTLDTVVKRADEALYRAKANGRNRVEIAASVAFASAT